MTVAATHSPTLVGCLSGYYSSPLDHQPRYAHSLCPDEWMEKWDGEREEGNFPGIKYKADE